ncbi:uncharacterized protein LOC100183384 [Ciona intestinalis]
MNSFMLDRFSQSDCRKLNNDVTDKKVKFHDVTESGYSTTTSSDDGNSGKTMSLRMRAKEKREMTSSSMTPSPTSSKEEYYVTHEDNYVIHDDSYYDPLHLNHEPSKRGILKKPPTGNPLTPIKVPALYPSSPHGSDASRKSAFTPVAQRHHSGSSDPSDVINNLFTPLHVTPDYVTADYVTNNMTGSHYSKPESPLQGFYPVRHRDVTHTHARENPRKRDDVIFQTVQPPVPKSRVMPNFETLRVDDVRVDDVASLVGSEPEARVEELTNDAARIEHFFDNANAKEIKRLLRHKLDSKDPRIIKALSTLFPANVAKPVMSHCVRCHKSYNLDDRGRCHLPHPELMVSKVGQDDEGTDFVCHCCSTGFRLLKMDFYEESTNAILTGHCYSGHHTTDPGSVDYQPDGGAAKSCVDNGCVEFYV